MNKTINITFEEFFKENIMSTDIQIIVQNEGDRDRFIAVSNGQKIGYGVVQFNLDKNNYWITGLKLLPDFKRKGIGTKIIDKIKEQNYNKPIMVRASPYNESEISEEELINFYIRNGFEPYGSKKGYLKLNEKQSTV